MAKLRNGGTDVEKLTQWFGRKARNHHPLEELKLPVSSRPQQTTYKAKEKANIVTLKDDGTVLLYMAAGRMFEIRVRECDPEEYADRQKVAVGY